MQLKIVIRLLWLFSILVFVGCDSETSSPLKIASHEWPGYEPLHLARELGYFDENQIQVFEVASATSAIRAFRNGNIEVAALTLDEVLLLLQDNVPVKILLVLDVSKGADAIVAHPPISTLKALKGKRIGVESMALGAYMLSRALDFAGLYNNDVTPVYVPFNKHESSFLSHDIDALVTFEPVKGKLIAKGATPLLDSRQLPNEIVDVLVIHEKALQDKPAAVTALIKGWFKALDYLQTQKPDAAQIIARRIDSTPSEFLTSLETIDLPDRNGNLALLSGNPPALDITCKRLMNVMLSHSLLVRELQINELFIPNIQTYLTQ